MNNSGKIVQLVNPTAAQDAATKSYVDTSIPIGGIIMWSGAGVTLPSNWKLCDGTTYNGVTTPDLRGRFVLSSGQGSGLTNRTTGGTGGSETVTLTEAQMPSHSHNVSATTDSKGSHNHTVTVTDPGHYHQQNSNSGPNNRNGGPWWGSATSGGGPVLYTESERTGISVSLAENGNHTHTITVTESSKGSGQAHENMPPFYVLAFIMRVS